MVLVILVVIGHSTYYDIITHFGGIKYGMLMKEAGIQDTIFHKFVNEITNYIYTFHMPVFISLSGSLFALGKKINMRALIAKKAKRLLIPFFVVWLFWNIPIKYFSGYYDNVNIGKMIEQMIFPSCVYLWYLECLFFVFIIVYLICKFNEKTQIVVVFLCWIIGVIIYRKYSQYHFLGDPLYYVLWFYLGYKIESIITWCKSKKVWNDLFAGCLILSTLVLFLISSVLQFKILGAVCRYIVNPFFALVAMNYCARKSKNSLVQCACSDYSLGIYLYAEPLNYWLLYVFYNWKGITFFGTEIGALIIYFSRLIITPIIAIGITRILKKLKIKYLY